MSAISVTPGAGPTSGGGHAGVDPPTDRRIVRSRAALLEAARTLFLEHGYAGTTMEDVAAAAGLAKRTVYNHYADKEALFREIVTGVIAQAEAFARALPAEFERGLSAGEIPDALHDLGRRLALGILQPHVVALRRLLVGEARSFPQLADAYFYRAPGRVLVALAAGFEHLGRAGLLRVGDARRAAEQFAYLVAGEPLDRAMLVGTLPTDEQVAACAREGVETFLARYGVEPGASPTPSPPRGDRG